MPPLAICVYENISNASLAAGATSNPVSVAIPSDLWTSWVNGSVAQPRIGGTYTSYSGVGSGTACMQVQVSLDNVNWSMFTTIDNLIGGFGGFANTGGPPPARIAFPATYTTPLFFRMANLMGVANNFSGVYLFLFPGPQPPSPANTNLVNSKTTTVSVISNPTIFSASGSKWPTSVPQPALVQPTATVTIIATTAKIAVPSGTVHTAFNFQFYQCNSTDTIEGPHDTWSITGNGTTIRTYTVDPTLGYFVYGYTSGNNNDWVIAAVDLYIAPGVGNAWVAVIG